MRAEVEPLVVCVRDRRKDKWQPADGMRLDVEEFGLDRWALL